MRRALLPVVAVVIAGCANPQSQRPAYTPMNTAAPTCASSSECSAMWSRARDQIQALTRMRLRVATDSYMETYVGHGVPLVGYVERIDLGSGKYEIRGRVACQRPGLCSDLPERATDLFNINVGRG